MFNAADFTYLIIAIFLCSALHILSPISPKIIFASLGSTGSYSDLLAIHILRLPARYLPGGIWHTVGRLSGYHSIGIPKKDLTVLAFIEIFSPCLITFFLGGGCLWLVGKEAIWSSIEGMLALISAFILLLIPFLVKWRFTSYLKKNFIFYYSFYLFLSIFFWIIASLSFLLYYSAISQNFFQISSLHIAAAYIFSWGIGYISIFAPQGLGVFEIVAQKLMELPMTLGGAVTFLAGFRIVVLLADSLVWLLYRFFFYPWRHPAEKKTIYDS